MTWELAIILVLLLYAIAVSFYCFKFAMIILRVEDSIEKSLDKIDDRYASIDKVMQTPLFFDSPEIKRVLSDVSGTRDAILEIANILSRDFDSSDEQEADEG